VQDFRKFHISRLLRTRRCSQHLPAQFFVQAAGCTWRSVMAAACAPATPSLSRLAITQRFREAVADLSVRSDSKKLIRHETPHWNSRRRINMNSRFIASSLQAGEESTPLRLLASERAIAPLFNVGGDATLRSTENWNSRAIAHRFHTVQKIHGTGFPEVSHQSFAPNQTMQPTASRAVFGRGDRLHLALSHGGCMRTRRAFAVSACNHAQFRGSCG